MTLSASNSRPATDPTSELAIAARGLRYSYGQRRALDGLDFSVVKGEAFAFLGPNGGGKTTLFRLLSTLASPQEGVIEVFGIDLGARPAEARRRLGVVFQNPSLDLELTVAENLFFQGNLYGLRGRLLRQRVEQQLVQFGITERRNERAKALSGGLRRRVEIAKALLHEPDLLLLDEPSTGLDPGARRDLWQVLQALQQNRGVTILLTTHFMDEADRCDRIALIDRGHLVALAAPEELKEEIGGQVVTLKVGEPEAFRDALVERFGFDAVIVDGTIRFELSGAHQSVARLAEAFPGAIHEMTIADPTLEDVFLRRTGHRIEEEGS